MNSIDDLRHSLKYNDQSPNLKLQINTNNHLPNSQPAKQEAWILIIGTYLVIGAWNLEIYVYPTKYLQ